MKKNGETVALDVPAKLVDGRTLVPVRAVSEGLGACVTWYGETYEIDIRSAGTVYPVTQLSQLDEENVENKKILIRYTAETGMLPFILLEHPEETITRVMENDKDLLDEVHKAWNLTVIEFIRSIQYYSTSKYEFPENMTNEQITAAYEDMIPKYNLTADGYFESGYCKTPGGKDVLLITFRDTDHGGFLLGCTKYCAFVVAENIQPRYFIAETNIFYESQFMHDGTYAFSEITLDDHGYFDIRVAGKDEFLKSIDDVIDSGREMIIIGE